jgi:hypothetical protein
MKEVSMTEEPQLELTIESQDEDVISSAEATLGGVVRKRLPPARTIDPQTILELGAAGAQLMTALLALRDRIASRPGAPAIKVRNARADEVDLREADVAEIEAVVTAAEAAG